MLPRKLNFLWVSFLWGDGINIADLLFAKVYLFYSVLESWSPTKYMQITYIVTEVPCSGTMKWRSPCGRQTCPSLSVDSAISQFPQTSFQRRTVKTTTGRRGLTLQTGKRTQCVCYFCSVRTEINALETVVFIYSCNKYLLNVC